MLVGTDERYHRQKLIPNWDQDKLKQAKVLILGVGATGSYLATNLVLSGVGNIILVDYDTIEKSNLNRQLLFRDEDIGKNKADVAKERLLQLNPDINIISHPLEMEKLSKKLIKDTTVIASCLDTFPGRRWANSLAIREKIPMVSGGMYAFLGNVQTIIPDDTACFECQPLIPATKLAQACTPLGEKRKSLHELKQEIKLPSVSTLSSIVSGLMSQEVLKLILEIGEMSDYLFYDGLYNSFTHIKLSRNPNCTMCGDKYKLAETEVIVFRGEQVKDLKYRIALGYGMADPMLTIRGKILQEESIIECNPGDKILVIDERLAKPVALVVTLKDKEIDSTREE